MSGMDSRFTAVPHGFIDTYMAAANGEFVKVYLYLLRSLDGTGRALSLPLLADRLFCTEKDILRALGYWEKQGLLSLSRDENGQPTGIVLLEIDPGTQAPLEGLRSGNPAEEAALSEEKRKSAPYREKAPENLPPGKEDKDPSEEGILPVPQFSRDRLDALKQDEDFSQLLFLTEMYLGKTLNSTEINSLCYYYDTLKFPAELIEYLVESCVSKGHKSFHYIETVAQHWHSAGIRTVQEAKQQSSQYTRQYYSVLRAFGVTDRSPVDQEIRMIDHWMNDFGFSTEMICEACSRAVRAIGKVSFPYADGILTNWHKQKIHNREDLKTADARHAGAKPPQNGAGEKKASANNRFNNFSQREYDYRKLEQQLLNKQ